MEHSMTIEIYESLTFWYNPKVNLVLLYLYLFYVY
jgi:hypothetical protein